MGHRIRRLRPRIALVWLAVIVICALAGWPVAAAILFLIPALLGVILLLWLFVYWRRQPPDRHVAASFDETHHIGHWHHNG
jgi:uncharacterized membrane protein YfcA